MKQNDLAMVIIVTVVSGAAAYFLSNLLITSPKNRKEKVEVVQPISAIFPEADKKYFNEQSYNPTQLITIGNDNNNTPFNAPR